MFARHPKSEGKESTSRTLKRIIPPILRRKGSELGEKFEVCAHCIEWHLSCMLQGRENSFILRCYTCNIFYIQNINEKKGFGQLININILYYNPQRQTRGKYFKNIELK